MEHLAYRASLLASDLRYQRIDAYWHEKKRVFLLRGVAKGNNSLVFCYWPYPVHIALNILRSEQDLVEDALDGAECASVAEVPLDSHFEESILGRIYLPLVNISLRHRSQEN